MACAILLVAGCGSSETDNQWSIHKGAAWEQFAVGYEKGFAQGCDKLFRQSPTGELRGGGRQYTVADCRAEDPRDARLATQVPTNAPSDPGLLGRRAGIVDGCEALFQQRKLKSLAYGKNRFAKTHCTRPGALDGPPLPRIRQVKKRKKSKSVSAPVNECGDMGYDGSTHVDGAGIYNITTRGISCEKARPLILAGESSLSGQGFACQTSQTGIETGDTRCTKPDGSVIRYQSGA